MRHAIAVLLTLFACDHATPPTASFRAACEDTGDPPPPPPTVGIPTPTAPCPTFTDGVVSICPAALLTCRDVVVRGSATAAGGPLVTHWHGTGEDVSGLLAWDTAVMGLETMAGSEIGLLVLPLADPAAVARAGNPFPWWVVCGPSGSNCSRPDDFILADEIVACAVDQNLVDPQRITASGFSAGAIMASHLVDRVDYLAAVVSWSGGLPEAFQPTTPAGPGAVLALHGGAADLYCGPGQPGCYPFQETTEALAQDVSTAGRFAFVCDHQAGHVAAMGAYGSAFLRDGRLDAGHLWTGYPLGHPGTGGDWMLNNYCYPAGTASPWD